MKMCRPLFIKKGDWDCPRGKGMLLVNLDMSDMLLCSADLPCLPLEVVGNFGVE